MAIRDPDIREALAIMRISITNKYDAFYFYSAMNLLNAWATSSAKTIRAKLFSNRYYFKEYVTNNTINIIEDGIDGIDIYIDRSLIMVKVMGFQFSFHSPLNPEKLTPYMNRVDNRYQEWSGEKLQPVAPLVFRLAKLYLMRSYSGPCYSVTM